MFGSFRIILALLVVFEHLGSVEVIGTYAVYGFYALSGYLMTLILKEKYGYSPSGIKRYILNRFLRIYPLYWLSVILSIIIITAIGAEYSKQYHDRMFLPNTLFSILGNMLLVLSHYTKPRLTPPAWALTIEIVFYLLIAIGIAKSKKRVLVWFSISMLYTVIVNLTNAPWSAKYFVMPAASLPFSTGALLYHYRSYFLLKYRVLLWRWLPLMLILTLFTNYAVSHYFGLTKSVGFYVNYLIVAVLILCLSKQPMIPLITKKTDKILGDLSYPVYLFHYQIGLIMIAVGIPMNRGSNLFAILSLPLIILFSWLIAMTIERPLDIYRHRFKQAHLEH